MSAGRTTAVAALAALLAIAAAARAQDAMVLVEVASSKNIYGEQEKYTPELQRDLHSAKTDAMMLYTEFTAKAGADLKRFLNNISAFADDAVKSADGIRYDDIKDCRDKLQNRLKKIKDDAYTAASFSGENHHKFLLGPMIVFRMHLNKSEDYINKCGQAIRDCGQSCETTPKVKRWRRLAALEIHRVQDDLQHTRRSYRDLVAHARRKLNHLRRQVTTSTSHAVEEYHECLIRG